MFMFGFTVLENLRALTLETSSDIFYMLKHVGFSLKHVCSFIHFFYKIIGWLSRWLMRAKSAQKPIGSEFDFLYLVNFRSNWLARLGIILAKFGACTWSKANLPGPRVLVIFASTRFWHARWDTNWWISVYHQQTTISWSRSQNINCRPHRHDGGQRNQGWSCFTKLLISLEDVSRRWASSCDWCNG